MKKILFPIIFLISLNIALADPMPDFPFVVSSGAATIKVKPTTAEVLIYLGAFEKQSDIALQKINDTSRIIIDLLEKHSISTSHLEASNINKNTKYHREGSEDLEILGYQITRQMKLKMDELESFEQLVDSLAALNNLSYLRTSFDVSNKEKINKELMRIAGQKAKEKAIDMANSLDAEIDSLYAVSETSSFDQFLTPLGIYSSSGAGFARDKTKLQMFVPDTIELSKKINVVFRIKEN